MANTTAYELLAWAGLALVVARIGRTGDCRWWLAGGLVAGLGVADDHSMSFFAIALVIGALLSGGRRMIWNRRFLAGAAIAVAFEVPDLWWQAQHGWATIAMTRALNRENGGLADIGTWVAGQLGMVTLALAWVWVAGLRFLWRSGLAVMAGDGLGVRAAVRALRGHHRGEALRPGRSVRVPARRRRRGHRRMAAGAARAGWRIPPRQRAHHRGGRPDRLAGAPGGRHRLDRQDQPDPGRDRWLARVRADR